MVEGLPIPKCVSCYVSNSWRSSFSSSRRNGHRLLTTGLLMIVQVELLRRFRTPPFFAHARAQAVKAHIHLVRSRGRMFPCVPLFHRGSSVTATCVFAQRAATAAAGPSRRNIPCMAARKTFAKTELRRDKPSADSALETNSR